MELLKKAFKVWHDGMISENPYEGYTFSELPVVYAENVTEAKQLCEEPFDFLTKENLKPTFIDLKVRRAKHRDIIIFEGIKMERINMDMIIKERERIKKRKELVEKFSDDTTFYIQNGFVGNSILWWALNGHGYTTDIFNAQIYTKKEVLERFVNGRLSDVIWESKHVQSKIKHHVDSQYLSNEFCC